MAWRSYLTWYLLALLLLIGLTASFNLVVDPHARFLWVDISGFNQVKVALAGNSRKGKATALRQCNYDAIVLGTSRAETAIAVDQPDMSNLRIYNAALRGGTMYEMQRMAEYAAQHQDLRIVLLGLDFEAFDTREAFKEDFSDSPLAEGASFSSAVRYLLSVDSLWQALVTVRMNRQGRATLCADNGERKRQYELAPPRGAFDFILKTYARDQYQNYKPGKQHFQSLATLLNAMADENTRVYGFIFPVHVTHRELITEMGLLDEYVEWKRNLVRIFEEANRNVPEQGRAVLWDFSGYNEITTEQVPSPDTGRFMRWYEDSAHTNKDVGFMMTDRMFRSQSSKPPINPEFGVVLTSENLEEVIQKDQHDSEIYRRSNPEEIRRMRAMLDKLR